MAIKNKTGNNKCRRGGGEKGRVLHRWWECKPVKALGIALWNCLRNFKIHLPYGPAIPLQRVYPKKLGTLLHRDPCSAVFTTAFLPICKTWKFLWCPSRDPWRRKVGYNHTMA